MSSYFSEFNLRSLGSVIPLTIDLLFDFFSQTAEIAAVAQIKERLTILMTLAAFNITFLCCRDLGSIPVVYIGANCVRANVIMTAIYNAVVPGRILHMLAVTNMNLLRLKQIFVRYVSHEIRSPLNVVHVGLEMLVALINRADPTSPFISIDRDTADFIIQMFFSSESAINILNDLLQYENIEAGNFRLSCAALSLVNVLENKFGWANVMASQKGVAFQVNDTSFATEFGPIASVSAADEESGLDSVADESLSAQRSLILYIDIYRIEQVIRNLITNAMKFTPTDGAVSVAISCVQLSAGNSIDCRDKFGPDAVGFFRVAVTDSGAGLSEEEQNRIFGEFTQFNKNELQSGGGSGLGLWISRQIVQMHKGIMGVTSAGRGHGSTFFFELPVFGPDYSPPQPITETQQQPHAQPEISTQQLESRPSRLLCQSPPTIEDGKDDRSYAYTLQPDMEAPPNVTHTDPASFYTAEEVLGLQLMPIESPCASPSPVRVLIVDDSSLNVKVVARLIESEKTGPFANATLLTADDGATA
eukprot:gene34723-biopygen27455